MNETTATKSTKSGTAAKKKRNAAARPKPGTAGKQEARTRMVRIDARIPSHIKEIVQYAASIQGRSQTDFMVTAIHEAAQKVIADTSVIRLCIEDQRKLAAALLDDAKPSDNKGLSRLRRAIHEHGKKVESV